MTSERNEPVPQEAAGVAVDDRDDDGELARRVRLRGNRPQRRRRGPRRGLRLPLRASARGQRKRDREREAQGSGTSGSGTSSANSSNVPLSPAVKHRCEKNRVITTPSRNSPKRGSGSSPFASAIASSG